jgi:hypothetical protein
MGLFLLLSCDVIGVYVPIPLLYAGMVLLYHDWSRWIRCRCGGAMDDDETRSSRDTIHRLPIIRWNT